MVSTSAFVEFNSTPVKLPHGSAKKFIFFYTARPFDFTIAANVAEWEEVVALITKVIKRSAFIDFGRELRISIAIHLTNIEVFRYLTRNRNKPAKFARGVFIFCKPFFI